MYIDISVIMYVFINMIKICIFMKMLDKAKIPVGWLKVQYQSSTYFRALNLLNLPKDYS